MRIHLFWRHAEGDYDKTRQGSHVATLTFLQVHGWPPVVVPWKSFRDIEVEGNIDAIFSGGSFGDGSGKHQEIRETRCATWAVARRIGHRLAENCIRGNVDGWFPTVPRGELLAYVYHLKASMVLARYIGDCSGVIKGVAEGNYGYLCSSKSLHADL